jgi:hypothetical protein
MFYLLNVCQFIIFLFVKINSAVPINHIQNLFYVFIIVFVYFYICLIISLFSLTLTLSSSHDIICGYTSYYYLILLKEV